MASKYRWVDEKIESLDPETQYNDILRLVADYRLGRPTRTTRHDRRAAGAARSVRRRGQHLPPAPLTAAPHPLAAYLARPKTTPTGNRPPADVRVRRDRVDTSGVVTLRHHGRLHHIGLGRALARTHVLLLVHDLNIRVINATSGELVRELILDPTRDYQPHRAGPTQHKAPNP